MKAFAPFKDAASIDRNGVSFKLTPTAQEKGSKGSVPALLFSDFNLEKFITWFAKPDNTFTDPKATKEQKEAAATMATNKFNSFIADSISTLIQQVWIDSGESYWIEYTPTKGVPVPKVELTPDIQTTLVASFISNLQSRLNGEIGAVKVRDSAYYMTEAKRVTSLFVKETDATKKAALKLEALNLKKTADELAKKEQDDILNLLN